jgi:hypothetical protein
MDHKNSQALGQGYEVHIFELGLPQFAGILSIPASCRNLAAASSWATAYGAVS